MEVQVMRGDDGGLGLLVDQDNTVVTVTAQPDMQVGDVIVGVDGDTCGSRPVGQCLTPGAPQYTFSIVRPSASEAAEALERNLRALIKDSDTAKAMGVAHFSAAEDEEDASEAESAEKIVLGLETAETGGTTVPSSEALGTALRSGFWRLILVSDEATARGGMTGYGFAPFCTVRGSFQAFIDLKGEHTAQCVEVIANANLGTCNVAAIKGVWSGGEASASAEAAEWAGAYGANLAAVLEKYDRTEYGGAADIDASSVVNSWVCTYLSDRMRVCRLRGTADGAGAWRVYERVTADAAQAEIGRLMSLPVAPPKQEGPPDWGDSRLGGGYERGLGGAYGGGYGDGPSPELDRMGPM